MKFLSFFKGDKSRMTVYILTIILSVAFLVVGNAVARNDFDVFGKDVEPALDAVVLEKHRAEYDDEIKSTRVTFLAEITSGENKGKNVTCEQIIDDVYIYSAKEVEIGDKVLIYSNAEGSETEYSFSEYRRTDSLFVLLIAFLACLLLFGGKKGFNTVISLGFTVLSVFVVFLPACLSGQNIYVWTVITCTFIIVMTLLVVYGIKKQSIAAAISCFSGMLVCGGLTLVMSNIMKLTGMIDDSSYHLTLLPTSSPINLNAITFAAITIGAIGAVMDVSISISSSLQEVNAKAPNLSRVQLMGSGMTIGRDMMGTMANTLVLAYIGSSLAMTLVLMVNQPTLIELLNMELIITELLQILVGSFGILMTIPLTSLICSIMYKKTMKKTDA